MSARDDAPRGRMTVGLAGRAVRGLLAAGPEELARVRDGRLRGVIESALRVPAYRDRWAGIETGRVRTAEDLPRLPPIERTELARHPLEARMAQRPAHPVLVVSTGTSGRSMESARSPEEDAFQQALWLRQERAQGLPLDAPHLHLRIGLDRMGPFAVDGPRATLGAYRPIDEQVAAVRAHAPRVLIGPPSVVVELGEALGGYPAEGVMTYGETLDPSMREDIGRAYGTDPFDLYATSEAGVVAWQCGRRDAYHVNADAVVVETLREDGAPTAMGETGEVALTVLWNRTTPFVRYRVGDLAALVPDACGCGVTLPRMSRPAGRTNDWVVRADGGRVSPFRLTLGVLGPEWITFTKRYRIVQRDVGDFLLEVVWRDAPVRDMAERLQPVYEGLLGGPVRIEVREVEALTFVPGTKFRLVESLVTTGS